MAVTHRSEHLRRPPLALAAELLVALGFAIAFLLLGGHAADAADRAGPLRAVTREAGRAVHHATVGRVVQVSPETRTPARRPGVGRRPQPAHRAIRVLPRGDDRELVRIDVPRAGREIAVDATPDVAGHALPVRLEIPALLPGLPSVDLSINAAAESGSRRAIAPLAAGASVPAMTAVAPAERPEVGSPHAVSPDHHRRAMPHVATPARLPFPEGSEGQLPTSVASAGATALAVVGKLALRAPTRPSQPVRTAHGAAPVAPSFEPSFTPD